MPDKRRSQRIGQDITIQLVSIQPGASYAVAQPARTIDVSGTGALLECRSKFEVGAEVMIHNPNSLQNGSFKVIRSALTGSGSAWNIAVELEAADVPDFWGIR